MLWDEYCRLRKELVSGMRWLRKLMQTLRGVGRSRRSKVSKKPVSK